MEWGYPERTKNKSAIKDLVSKMSTPDLQLELVSFSSVKEFFVGELVKISEILVNENHDIAIAMSPSRADPVLPWLGVFKCLIQCYCTVWGYLNI